MKLAGVALLLIFCSLAAASDEVSYRATIDAAHRRLGELDKKRGRDHALPPAEETERYALIGRLMTEDPVWALHVDMIAEMAALGSGKPLTPEEATEMEDLRELWGITGEFVQRATTLPEAKAFASILRQFIVRRDVDGARAWAKAQ
jgi:hypothetical protein